MYAVHLPQPYPYPSNDRIQVCHQDQFWILGGFSGILGIYRAVSFIIDRIVRLSSLLEVCRVLTTNDCLGQIERLLPFRVVMFEFIDTCMEVYKFGV